MECCGNTIKDLYGFSCPLKCSTYILQSVIIIVFGVITYLIWESFGKQAWFAELIWIAGWLSRITMGFSHTIYASSDRTFIFLTITMLFLSGWLIIKYRQVLIKRSLSIDFLILLAITWVPVIVRMLIPDKYI